MPEAEAYHAICAENETLRRKLKAMESTQRKKVKRPPNVYQQVWAQQYPVEVAHAKSIHATSRTLYEGGEFLEPYTKQYPADMNTSPHPKSGTVLDSADRRTFMRNVALRARFRKEGAGVRRVFPARVDGAVEVETAAVEAGEVEVETDAVEEGEVVPGV